MITRYRRHSRLNRLWIPLFAVAFLAYFGFNALNGSLGLWSLNSMEADAVALKARLDDLKTEHEAIDTKVASLRPESLDADFVDVEARTALNMLRPDEVVITFGAAQHRAE